MKLFPHVALSYWVYSRQHFLREPYKRETLSTVTSKTSERVLSFLFAHTCALSVMMLSQLSTCSSGGAHQQHKQRASAWDPVNGERKAVILNGTLISPCVMLPCRYQRRSLPGSAISHR
ncbi:hypothetical protein AOLI_G00124480 [Acnodon oligacanthus]